MDRPNNSLELPLGVAPSDAKRITIAEPQKLNVEDDLVAEQFQDFFRLADEHRKPRESVWDTAWDLYNGRYDWTGKEDWQSKVNIPKVRGVVDKAAGSFRRALIRMKRFYHIESETRLGIEQGFYTMNLLDYWLEQVNFVEEFTTGLKSGLITSTIVFKVWWDWYTNSEPHWETRLIKQPLMEFGIKVGETEIAEEYVTREPKTMGRLGVRAIDPYHFWIAEQNAYRIEKVTVDFSYIEALAKKGVYDKEAAEKLFQRSQDGMAEAKEQARKQERVQPGSSTKFKRPVDIYHYWGDLCDEDGKVIARNIMYTMGDKDVVLRKPQENPLFHGRDPYVVGTPYIVPFSTYNRGIVEDVSGIVTMMTNLACLIIDGAQFDALQAFEADYELIEDAGTKSLKKGIYPGIVIPTKAFDNTTGKPVVRPIKTGKIPQLAIQVMAMLDREQQLSTSVTNAIRGQDIGSETLGEFQSIIGSANEGLDEAARTVEETTLNELLEKSIATVYQYNEDYQIERLTENFPQVSLMLLDMTPEERYATMLGKFAFKARGVSVMMDKAQDLKQIDAFTKLVSAIPGVMARINVDELLENIIVGIGWNPSRILLNPGSQPVIPVAVQGGQPVPMGPDGQLPPPQMTGQQAAQLTPAQIVAGQQGAVQGGARNNPMANPTRPLPQ
jgi:hypothetical protein